MIHQYGLDAFVLLVSEQLKYDKPEQKMVSKYLNDLLKDLNKDSPMAYLKKRAIFSQAPSDYAEDFWAIFRSAAPSKDNVNKLLSEINQKPPYFAASVVLGLANIAQEREGINYREFEWILGMFVEALEKGAFE